MFPLTMRYFLFASCLLFFVSCSRYPQLQRQGSGGAPQFQELKPELNRSLYRARVEGKTFLKKFHLTGILLIKKMEHNETHVVFQNEMGISFFHFVWDGTNSFRVVEIIPQMNKDALIKTLKKDFEIVFMTIDQSGPTSYLEAANGHQIMRLPIANGFVDYRYSTEPNQLLGATLVDGRKLITEFNVAHPIAWKKLPDDLTILHKTARFSIHLSKLPTHDTP